MRLVYIEMYISLHPLAHSGAKWLSRSPTLSITFFLPLNIPPALLFSVDAPNRFTILIAIIEPTCAHNLEHAVAKVCAVLQHE